MNDTHTDREPPDFRDLCAQLQTGAPFSEDPSHPRTTQMGTIPANAKCDSDPGRTDAAEAFRAAMAAEGISTREQIIPDGRLHRIHVDGDRRGTRNGWYVLHTDHAPAGAFGSWRLGVAETWRAAQPHHTGVEARAALQASVPAAEERRRRAEAELHERARLKAERIWARAQSAPVDHGYLIEKQVKSHELRASCGRLLVPLCDAEGVLRSLQFIGGDGTKRFLAGGLVQGCFYLIGVPDEKLFVAEGYATAASIREVTGAAVAVAFTAGNLAPVAKSLRRRFGQISLVIAADDDYATPGNPGQTKASEAARAVGAKIAVPRFRTAASGGTDWNDLARIEGPEEARRQLSDAKVLPGATEGITSVEESPKEWPDPQPLGGDLPPVKPFQNAFLPEAPRAWVIDISERMQTPPDFAAAAAIVALAGSVSWRVFIQPKARDSSWVVVPNLWGAMIGPPGVMKSPAAGAIMRPLERIETANRSAFETDLRSYETANEMYDLEVSAWKEEVKRKLKTRQEGPARPEFAQTEPSPLRLITNDATFEALHQLLARNPAGLLVHRDELTGWLAGLDRQGREGERAFFLEAWNGDKPFTQDRISRGSIHVAANCLSLFGGIQPGRLRSYLADALKDGPANDGLIQRFQVVVWPDVSKEWTRVDRLPDMEAEAIAKRVFQKLVSLEAETARVLTFAPDAQELFDAWFTENQIRVRSGECHPAMTAHIAKYPKLMPALALLFELADWAAADRDDVTAVSLKHARQAAALCDEYLESHATRMYSCITAPEIRAARDLGEKLRRAKLPETFSLRDVYLKGWTGLGTPTEVRAALGILVDSAWVRELPCEPLSSGGRPSERYQINPKVLREQVA